MSTSDWILIAIEGLVELGMSLRGVRTALNVERAMEMLQVASANGHAAMGEGTDDRRPD